MNIECENKTIEKKEYVAPQMTVVEMPSPAVLQSGSYSGGGDDDDEDFELN